MFKTKKTDAVIERFDKTNYKQKIISINIKISKYISNMLNLT